MKNKIILILALFLFLTPLSYAIIWSDESNVNIIILSNKPVCQVGTDRDDTGWWENGSSLHESFYDCYREVVDSGSHGCCPEGYICNNSTLPGQCVYSSAQLCSQYNNKNECSNYNQDVAKNDVESKNPEVFSAGEDCLRLITCECYWDQTANGGQGQCDSRYSINDSCNSSLNGVCSYTTNVIEKCNETGVIETNWRASWSGSSNKPDTCSDGSSTIRCLSTALLPFIGIFAIIILIILIIIHYFLKKKNSKIKKKKR